VALTGTNQFNLYISSTALTAGWADTAGDAQGVSFVIALSLVPASGQISMMGSRLPLNAPAVQFGLELGLLAIGGKKKKSGLPFVHDGPDTAQ